MNLAGTYRSLVEFVGRLSRAVVGKPCSGVAQTPAAKGLVTALGTPRLHGAFPSLPGGAHRRRRRVDRRDPAGAAAHALRQPRVPSTPQGAGPRAAAARQATGTRASRRGWTPSWPSTCRAPRRTSPRSPQGHLLVHTALRPRRLSDLMYQYFHDLFPVYLPYLTHHCNLLLFL